MNGKETSEERESFIFQSFAQLLITLTDYLFLFYQLVVANAGE